MTEPNDPRYRIHIPRFLAIPGDLMEIPERQSYLAGLVPFNYAKNGAMQFYVARPQARKPDLPPPDFQIGKGTRMMLDNGQWRDIRQEDLPLKESDDAEALYVTALREAEEELGLKPESVTNPIYAFGVHRFFSATTREPKDMALFFTELHAGHRFSAPDATHGKTQECRWLTLPEHETLMRPNHAKALDRFETWLKARAKAA
ncbi:NUDIX domain-containing protein [bacterium]|nr:NUDIX domain-containing protein [bacterium]